MASVGLKCCEEGFSNEGKDFSFTAFSCGRPKFWKGFFHLIEQMFYRATAASVGQKRYMEGLPMRGRSFLFSFERSGLLRITTGSV